jgi:hypothetical protein
MLNKGKSAEALRAEPLITRAQKRFANHLRSQPQLRLPRQAVVPIRAEGRRGIQPRRTRRRKACSMTMRVDRLTGRTDNVENVRRATFRPRGLFRDGSRSASPGSSRPRQRRSS